LDAAEPRKVSVFTGIVYSGYRLLGVVSGYYKEAEDFTLEIAAIAKGTAGANSGVAVVVPARFLSALLDDPGLRATRESYFARPAVAAKP